MIALLTWLALALFSIAGWYAAIDERALRKNAEGELKDERFYAAFYRQRCDELENGCTRSIESILREGISQFTMVDSVTNPSARR